MNIGTHTTRTKIGIVTQTTFDADHTPKRERKKDRPDDEEIRSLMVTVRDALEEQGIELVAWWAEQGPYHQIGPLTKTEIRRREEREEAR